MFILAAEGILLSMHCIISGLHNVRIVLHHRIPREKRAARKLDSKKTDSSVQVGAGLIISAGFHLFHFCNSLFFLGLL